MDGLFNLPRDLHRRPRASLGAELGVSMPPDAAEQAAWLRAIAEDADRAAFAQMFSYFAPRVKAYLLRLSLPPAQAEELAQEAMLTVWRRAGQFEPASMGAAAWVFTIARNLRVDAARRARLAGPNAEPADAPDPTPWADAQLDTARQADRLRAALTTLPPEQAAVVQMAFFDDRPHAQIERELGIPLGTVKSRLRLAMARLRAQLDSLT